MSVVIETTLGDLTVDLFTEDRPQTCRNFIKLCKLKYYNFSLFHTVQANFIAQTGDPTGTGSGGESVYGIVYGSESKYYEAESMPKIKHTKPGLLSMVNCGNNMLGSQFFVTLGNDLQSLNEHCVFGEVTEGHEVLIKLNEAVCDFQNRPYRDIRITHTVILDDPFEDISGMQIPDASPDISQLPASNGRLGADEDVGEDLTGAEIEEVKAEQEARARATILEIVGDIPHADIAPPENVLFVCKLNPVTNDEDLELIFSRFGQINSCEVIRDHITGESLQYAFIEFGDKKSCEQAYMKMDNVLIDDRRIHVDFSQSVSKIRWKGKGRGVELLEKPEDNQPKPLMDLRYSSASMMSRGREQQFYKDRDRRGREDRRPGRDDGRPRRREEDRRDDRRREEDRRRRGERHDSRRQADSSFSRRHREYPDLRHGRSAEDASERHHRRNQDLSSQESVSNKSGRQETDRPREHPVDYKHIKPLLEKPIRPPRDNGNFSKVPPFKVGQVSPTKLKVSPQVKDMKMSKPFEEEDIDQEVGRNESLSQSNIHSSDVGSLKNSGDSKRRKKITKKKSKSKRRGSCSSSISSESSSTSSSSSSSSSSTSSSSSSDHRLSIKKNGKSRKHKHSGVLTKKYYDRKGKLIKVVKKHRKHSSSSSVSTSDSDTERKRGKRKHKKKKKNKLIKLSKKGSKKSSEDEDDDDSEDGLSDDGEVSKSSKTSIKGLKKRKAVEKQFKSNKMDADKTSETSDNEDEETLSSTSHRPSHKKKFKFSSDPLKTS